MTLAKQKGHTILNNYYAKFTLQSLHVKGQIHAIKAPWRKELSSLVFLFYLNI